MEQKKQPLIKKEIEELNQLQSELGKSLKSIKPLINSDLTDKELLVFLGFSNKIGLNPLLQEIIPVVYYKNDPSRRRVNYIVTRNGKRVIAARSGELEGIKTNAIYVKKDKDGEVKRVEEWEGGALWGAECTVIRKGQEYRSVVKLSEYTTGKDVWASKPSTMIKKVAESQALTAAFPEVLGSVYDESEIEINKGEIAEVEDIEESTKPATDAQKSTMSSLGIEFDSTITYGEAKILIGNATNTMKK